MSVVIYIFGGALIIGGVILIRLIARDLTRAEDRTYTNHGRFIRLPRSSSHRKRGF